jgi:hypothetical protein
MPRGAVRTSRDGVNGWARGEVITDALRVHHAAPGPALALPAAVPYSVHSRGAPGQAGGGSLVVSVLRDADRAFWTRTVWRDEAAMRSFMQSGVHRRILARLPEWCNEAAVVHWVREVCRFPTQNHWTATI